MSTACFDWLSCLLGEHPSASREGAGSKAPWAGWSAGLVVFNSCSISAPYFLHCCSFPPPPSPLSVSPAVRHMLIQGLPAELRHAERCAGSTPQEVRVPPLGCTPSLFLNSWDSQAVEGLIAQCLPLPWSSGCPKSNSVGCKCFFLNSLATITPFKVSSHDNYELITKTL